MSSFLENTSRFRRSMQFLAALTMLVLAVNASAYRTDHGLLPSGSSQCETHVPITLDLPANAEPIPDPFNGEYSGGFYHVEEIDDRLFYVTDGVYQAMFLVDNLGIILVDAPPSIGVNQADPASSVSMLEIIHGIPEAKGKPIRKMVYSHTHMDHIGAASIIKDAYPKVDIIAHRETREQLARGTGELEGLLPGSGANPPPLPNKVFGNKKTIRLGRQVVQLSYKGPIHEPGNIFIYAPKQKVLMLIDVIFPGWVPFTNLALAEDIPSFIDAHDKVLEVDFDVFIGGHFNRLGSRADVEEARAYILDVKRNALSALSDSSLFAIFGLKPRNGLGAFNIYLDQVACKCANLTLDQSDTPSGTPWLERLGNADISTLTHCWEMAEAIRIDPSF